MISAIFGAFRDIRQFREIALMTFLLKFWLKTEDFTNFRSFSKIFDNSGKSVPKQRPMNGTKPIRSHNRTEPRLFQFPGWPPKEFSNHDWTKEFSNQWLVQNKFSNPWLGHSDREVPDERTKTISAHRWTEPRLFYFPVVQEKFSGFG